MKFHVVLCYIVLTITITACASLEEANEDTHLQTGKKQMTKRETSVIIDNYPVESSRQESVVVERVTRVRPKHKPKHRSKPKYRPPGASGRYKKYLAGSKGSHPYRIPSRYKKYQTLPGKRIPFKSERPKKIRRPYETIKEPSGFGEPPNGAQPLGHQQIYSGPPDFTREPPTDSYGAPLKTVSNDNYHTITDYSIDNYAPNLPPNKFNQHTIDSSFATTKKQPPHYEHHQPFDMGPLNDQTSLNSYADVYKLNQHNYNNIRNIKHGKKNVFASRPVQIQNWRTKDEEGDQMLVGGQYAEPPGRYVPKHQLNAQMFTDDEEIDKATDYDTFPSSSNISPYVNYKNGNIAFSPQNLNDAFSIVDK